MMPKEFFFVNLSKIYLKMRYSLLLFSFILLGISCWSQEICDNGIDDDSDGFIDLNDSECICTGLDTLMVEIPSLIPNASFEVMDCCPSSYSELNCAGNWIQASEATSDYMNTCDFLMPAMVSANLLPMPDGEGCVGAIIMYDDVFTESNYLEYVAACTNSPLIAGQLYTMTFFIASTPIDINTGGECGGSNIFYSDIDMILYGNPNCSSIPWSGSDCPSAALNWEILGSVSYTPVDSWGQVQISFTPSQDINTISLGAPCTLPASYSLSGDCAPYFFYDDLQLVSGNSGSITVTPNYSNCNYGTLVASIDTSGGSWQWYNEGVAIIGQTDSILDLEALSLQDGDYTVVYSIDGVCDDQFVNVLYIRSDSTSINIVACDSYYWDATGDTLTESGTYSEILQNIYGCDSTVILELDIYQNYNVSVDTTICFGDQVVVFGVGYNQTGFYNDTLLTVNGCDSTMSLNLHVFEKPEKPILSAEYPECTEGNIVLTAHAEEGYEVFWSGPTGYQWIGYQINMYASELNSGIFSAVISNQGCFSDSTQINVSSENLVIYDFEVPNVITSNEDGVNEYIDIREYYQGCEFKFTIVSRWGIIVFEQTEDTAPFNGMDKDGRKLIEGTYFYILEFDEETKHGFIQLIK